MISLLKKVRASVTLSLALAGLVAFLPACTYRKVVQLDSHKVTVTRHGFEKHFHVTERASAPRFEYAGISRDGKDLKVAIEGNKITVNGVDGTLHSGDAVFITDDGVAVNSMDYGESEKYLRANNKSTSEATVRN